MKCFVCLIVSLFITLGGCSVSKATNERRVVELPKDRSDATLAAAEKICRDLIAGGYGAEVQGKFPKLTPQQVAGLYLTWNAGAFSQTGKGVFITCGISYAGSLPEAKEV